MKLGGVFFAPIVANRTAAVAELRPLLLGFLLRLAARAFKACLHVMHCWI
jgi:hypothetical protein